MNTRPHTVLMTADTVGGVWTYALELCRGLQKFDVEIHLATMGRPLSVSQRNSADAISNLQVKESSFALEWMEDPWEEVDRAGEWLLELERQIQPDLIHLNNYVHGALPWQAPVLTVAHSCVLSWWEAVKKEPAPPEWDTYRRRVREGLQSSDAVVGVTRHMLNRVNHYYGPLPRSGCIYNARNSERFSAGKNGSQIFSMGRLWDEAKNISALNSIADDLPWPVHVAGEDRDTVTASDNLNLLGVLGPEQVSEWLAGSGIYVMPARYEPFGLSVLEAALSGCALVLGDIPSLREVWGDNALYADPEDPDHLRYQIRLLCASAPKRRRMAGKARRRAARYSPEHQADQYDRHYRRLLKRDRLDLLAG